MNFIINFDFTDNLKIAFILLNFQNLNIHNNLFIPHRTIKKIFQIFLLFKIIFFIFQNKFTILILWIIEVYKNFNFLRIIIYLI